VWRIENGKRSFSHLLEIMATLIGMNGLLVNSHTNAHIYYACRVINKVYLNQHFWLCMKSWNNAGQDNHHIIKNLHQINLKLLKKRAAFVYCFILCYWSSADWGNFISVYLKAQQNSFSDCFHFCSTDLPKFSFFWKRKKAFLIALFT